MIFLNTQNSHIKLKQIDEISMDGAINGSVPINTMGSST